MTSERYVPDYENYDYFQEWRGKGLDDLAEKRILSEWIMPANACLELGGGYGRITSLLEGYFSEMVMIDFSKRNIWEAKQRLRKTNIVRSEVGIIPFKDNTFDCVVMIRVIHHLPDPLKVLREIARVARGGSTVVISVPNVARRVKYGLKNELIATSEHGHRIYGAPLGYYKNEFLKAVALRGTGIFRNAFGKWLEPLRSLHMIDVRTSPLWFLKSNVFVKYEVCKNWRGILQS